jgi:ribosomal protein S18 acetylase RimI-like enzyme
VSPFSVEITDAPERDVVQFLDDRLYEFNAAQTGFDDGRLLAVLARDRRGRIAAGLYGWTWGGCCYVRTLWIDEPHRRRGLGTRLMALAEREARRRGARQIVLDTHSFQAPDFYRRLGFEIVGSFVDYPRGYSQIFLRKPLNRARRRTPRGRSSRTRRPSRARRGR